MFLLNFHFFSNVSCGLLRVSCLEVMPWQVYASLLPIIGGVGLASASELSFNWCLDSETIGRGRYPSVF